MENEIDLLQMENFHAEWIKKFYGVIVPFIQSQKEVFYEEWENGPCPRGSGKKNKNCCLRKEIMNIPDRIKRGILT